MSHPVVKATLMAILAMSVNGTANAETDKTDTMTTMAKPAKGMERCYGIVKAGLNDCAYAKQSCAGSSTADSEKGAWIDLPKGICHKIVGSSLVPPADETEKKS